MEDESKAGSGDAGASGSGNTAPEGTPFLRDVTRVITAMAAGDLSQILVKQGLQGEELALAETINGWVYELNHFANEVVRLARDIGVENRPGVQIGIPAQAGTWRDLADSLNAMSRNLANKADQVSQAGQTGSQDA
jgi:hypothetical protein